MARVDFDTEAADLYVETVRIAEREGVTLPSRPATNAAESDMARTVRARVGRVLMSLAAAHPLTAIPTASSTPVCVRCGAAEGLRLWRTVWPPRAPRIDLYVCRGGCSESKEAAE